LLSNLLILPQANASHINGFTFYIPYNADDLKAQFEFGRTGGIAIDAADISTTVSIAVLRDNTTVYYDHWEDGFERNLTDPVQSSTERFDRQAGDVIPLRNDVPVPRPDPPTPFLYDGGDKITAVGGSIAVSLAVWPEPLLADDRGHLYAGAWELYPTSRWCEDYVIPVGVDLASDRAAFTVTGFNVQAVEDNTLVEVFGPNNGPLIDSRTLREGENFPIISGIEAGTQVQASDPVQVQLFTGDPARTYEARAYTVLCRDEWADEYLAPRSSDGDFWFYNDSDSPLSVEVETSAGAQPPITLPANGAARYPPVGDPVLPARSGVLFSSSGEFYGIAALDDAQVQDWGYALLPSSSLTTQALIGWAPGNRLRFDPVLPDGTIADNPGDWPTLEGREASRVYVTALNTTDINVVYDLDTGRSDSFTVTPLEELSIIDPDDYDMTGAYLFTDTGERFIAVWGQDESAPPPDPSIDVGTNIAPLRAPSLQKTYLPDRPGFVCGTLSQSAIFRFDLRAYNDSALDIVNAVVQDDLPPEFSYVSGSTTQDGAPVPDNTSGSPFPLDGDGLNIGTIDAGGSKLVSFLAETDAIGEFINAASLTPSADPAAVEVMVPVLPSGYEVSKSLIDPSSGVADPGQVITFNLTISNTGTVAITELPLRDEFDPDVLTYSSASIEPNNRDDSAGEISWDDLTDSLGDLAPDSAPYVITLSYVVSSDLPSGVTSTINRAFSTGAQSSDGSPQAITCAEAEVSFNVPEPTPTPSPTPTPTPDDGDDDKKDPTPTPIPPSSVATPPPAPAPAPTPAVLLLPETGVGRATETIPLWPLALLPGIGLVLGWVVYRQRRGK
jgi:uncharacterized repeat protein (TIGR01451 family)